MSMNSPSNNPTNTKAINEKIEKGEVRVKDAQATKIVARRAGVSEKRVEKAVAEKREAKTENKAPSDEQVLNALKQIYAETKQPTTSRALSDKLGIKDSDFGRGAVRSAMRRLTAKKLAKTQTTEKGKTKFKYSPV